MAMESSLNPESDDFNQPRPNFFIGQHDTARVEALTDNQYAQVLNAGFGFATAPVTSAHFLNRVKELYKVHIQKADELDLPQKARANQSLPGPVVPTLTNKDTSLFPSPYVTAVVAYSSPWIDLCSSDPLIASISRQALNLEVAYANFCGVRSIIVPGPRRDSSGKEVAQYARALQEAFLVASRVNIIVHMPMYREPGLEETSETLTTMLHGKGEDKEATAQEIDLFSAWDSWHTIRSICDYNIRLFVALRIPKRLPEKELQTRWFAEPLHYLTFGPSTFTPNRSGHPSLSRYHQDMINTYMRLKNAPWFILYDVGPTTAEIDAAVGSADILSNDFPTLGEAHTAQKSSSVQNSHFSYLKYLERQQPPLTLLETSTLTSFQDWLQSPLQPLSDNLESATYEMFEGDPVKYDLYEEAITAAMAEWKELGKPTSFTPNNNSKTSEPELIVAVAGAGRGPLVTRVLRAAERTGSKIQLWALEKNQNAYVYLLRQNEREWGGKVKVVKTDMRDWPGPVPDGYTDIWTTKVDILVTELLGSFGDNELSPECLDGIQKHIAKPHGISIPESYTAWLSPISTPRIFTDLSTRVIGDANAFETPWVTRLFQLDFVSQKVPGKPRFQQAWEFVHPVAHSLIDEWEEKHGDPAPRLRTLGGGAMNNSGGLNEHNTRHCHLTFYCRPRGVIHGLAGFFESTLYRPQVEGRDLIELSILPDQIDKKSKDMISWFPIFFPLKQPLYFPQDSELEVSMWRQTDDTKVWYEWRVEAFTYIGPNSRVKVGASELHSSRKVACLMQ